MERSEIRVRPSRMSLRSSRATVEQVASPVKPTPPEAEQSPRHENDHRNKDDPDRNEVILGEKAGEGLAQQQEKTGADNGAYQCSNTAHDVEDHSLPGDREIDEAASGDAHLNDVTHAHDPH